MSAKRQIIITKADHNHLESLFFSELAMAFGDKPYLQSLRQELNGALILNPDEIPPDVVTMNSTVRIRDVHSEELNTYTLVYPRDADIAIGKLSVLAPIGTAILGYRQGDLVQWQVPSGLTRFRIEEVVFQPERTGVFV
ncbi:nucleoside diphosphate kinase regulator [Schlesneria paludicola]|uniref:nucleoside diphosphate kinase regulator n=1 Tax=Schlesneria paludicola TaxID=360056 RepID=UPI00029A4E30|nr:nucleoside diphosphate kinase regulator [Schlesneria paludicola]